ncbi:Callose synthase 9 [Nymphaea thermarum]|nr:Callose synthase 9 [Nymphaea thermarum]
MSRVETNWERLVEAVPSRERRGGADAFGQAVSRIAGNVSSSLARSADIDAILRAADEVQEDDPNVARICELFQSYGYAVSLGMRVYVTSGRVQDAASSKKNWVRMVREMEEMLRQRVAQPANSCSSSSGVSFLDQIISPLYEVIAAGLQNPKSVFYKTYIFVLIAYASVQLAFSLLMRIPACHRLTNRCDQWPVMRFIKWMHQGEETELLVGLNNGVCEHAYSLAQNLDPDSEGRGVLQFKTGLMSVIKQKLAKREAGVIDRTQDIARLQEFYKQYREKHKIDELQEEELRLRESGAFSSNLGKVLVPAVVTTWLNERFSNTNNDK